MFCAFEGPQLVLRLFGTGRHHVIGSAEYEALAPRFPALSGARAIIEVDIARVQTSCGYSIPFMEYREERPTLIEWADRRGDDGLPEYWATRTSESLAGLPTPSDCTVARPACPTPPPPPPLQPAPQTRAQPRGMAQASLPPGPPSAPHPP